MNTNDSMSKFLQILYAYKYESELYNKEVATKDVRDPSDFFNPVMDKLRTVVSNSVADEIEALIAACSVECRDFFAVDGMQFAIAIQNNQYVPII